ncbi:MAG TPA: hypothetical protein DCZ00_03330 [Lactococcus sp.]|jgi:hypothetical protein|uniref:Uncharacterized protein n=1 Tax=Parabacteroides goldsteinii TaxID=328812 RepID=A0A0J6CN21_9BACT|nr:hypothetical protein [Parabacteroides goldsteinii]KMM33569.1 hypothetical protein ACM15_11130 [Parabacteroides goldsteinii]HBC90458.1 hypothetical protein [Lactococcus sp.]
MESNNNNPVAALLQQALSLSEKSTGIPVIIDYEAITRAAIKAVREEREKIASDPKRLVTQNEAHIRYGKSVIVALVRRRYLQQYKFDLQEVYDEEGNLIKKAKGVIYYRVIEIEKAVEDGNVLKGTRGVFYDESSGRWREVVKNRKN